MAILPSIGKGLDIDNKLENLKANFDRVHLQTTTIINDWKNCYLPIEGRIAISKCLLVSQYTYISTIFVLMDDQIRQAQVAINKFIMGINDNQRNWIKEEKLYQPKKIGDLNCIELKSFLKAIKLNWIKRYAIHGYDDFWTKLLDNHLRVNPVTRKGILNWSSGEILSLIHI